MTDKHILHMLSPLRHVSPFDVNMAADAGFDVVVPYSEITKDDILPLVQDAIFSRPPKLAVKTGVFIGGRDAIAALDMLEAARKAMVPPFIVSVFADPAGSFTTAAAMVAKAAQGLQRAHGKPLSGQRAAVFGATGVVGFASAVIAALNGATVTLVGHNGVERVAKSAAEIKARFGVDVLAGDGGTEPQKQAILQHADLAFFAGRAGVQIASAAQIAAAPNLLVVADVNAVPPYGVEGLDVMDDGKTLSGHTRGIGALAIGHIKYQTEFGLFRRMIEATKPVALDFRDAFAFAQGLTG
jgi:methylene-tetrahydromethanopterin dehydrogenase